MKTIKHAVTLGFLFTLAPMADAAPVPNLITYQGRVQSDGTNVNGMGEFKFAIVNGGINTSVQATANAHFVGGEITAGIVVNPGSGYLAAPAVTITDPTGSGATITANISGGSVASLVVTRAGANYTAPVIIIAPSPPNVVFVTHWSNDGTSVNGSEPSTHVVVPVNDGLFTVVLGQGMAGLHHSSFTNSGLHLRVWFSEGTVKFEQLSPDQRLTTSPYAMLSARVEDGAITSAQLAPGAVTLNNLASNALNALTLTNHLELGDASTHGSLRVFHNDMGEPAIVLDGETVQIRAIGDGGQEKLNLTGRDFGHLTMFNQIDSDARVVLTALNERATGPQEGGGALYLSAPNGNLRSWLEAREAGGWLTLYGQDDQSKLQLRTTSSGGEITVNGGVLGSGAFLEGESENGGGRLSLTDSGGEETAELVARAGVGTGGRLTLRRDNGGPATVIIEGEDFSGQGARLEMNNESGEPRVQIDADANDDGALMHFFRNTGILTIVLDSESVGGGGEISVRNGVGIETVEITGAESNGAGGQVLLKRSNGGNGIQIDAQEGSTGGGFLRLYKGDGSTAITLDSEDGQGNGRVITEVLEITGGSDLSEKFDILASPDGVQPGMVACIDPNHPGRLIASSKAYDRTVAGVVSGAGGVRPGMLMGQAGSAADGKYPVALTGRVYCLVDAEYGSVQPGDLITTSDTPGHGMIVRNHPKAQGAILGKAMSSLDQGKGLVLVLVSLQ